MSSTSKYFHPPPLEKRHSAIPKTSNPYFHAHPQFFKLPVTNPGDWLYSRADAPLQTVGKWSKSYNKVTQTRKTIYIVPIGRKKKIDFLDYLAEYVELFIGLKVKVLNADKPLSTKGFKMRQHQGFKQILVPDLFESLRKMVPTDAYCLIGVTMYDLYPRESWNFVFGTASLSGRYGVFSFARYGSVPRLVRWRACRVSVHEIIHQFGVKHCICYQCLMAGSNSLEESDRRPPWLCPIDLYKMHKAVGFDIKERYERLIAWFEKQDAIMFQKHIKWMKARIRVCEDPDEDYEVLLQEIDAMMSDFGRRDVVLTQEEEMRARAEEW